MFVVSSTDAADDHLNIIQGYKVSVSLSGRSSCLKRHRLFDVVCAVGVVLLSSCGGGGGGGSSVVIGGGDLVIIPDDSFVPESEQVVGFADGATEGLRERQRVAALHRRGGTGKNQIVGVFDSGVNEKHPDLAGQFQYKCSLGRCDGKGGSNTDNKAALDRTDYRSPLEDTDGHGTSVNGVISAKRDGRGVYGIAYDAKIASFGNTAPVPWDEGCDSVSDNCNDLGHAWGSIFDEQTARGVDWIRSLNDVKIINNSWTRTSPYNEDEAPSIEDVRKTMPSSLSAWEKFVKADGVVVFANANQGTQNDPAIEAVLPHYFSDLKPGWLAVDALSYDGRTAGFSQRCGVAAEWCITAPDEMILPELSGQWSFSGGTSFAAPYVTAGLAALKSLFPNLTYHQLRTRILATADKTGPYADTQLYGQGRLNLDAASRPVGNTSLALGEQITGPVLPARGVSIALPDSFLLRPVASGSLLLVDDFQRAPFFVKLNNFIRPRPAYLSFSDLGLSYSNSVRTSQRVVRTGHQGESFTDFGKGEKILSGFHQVSPQRLPLIDYYLSDQAAGLTVGTHRWQLVAAHDNAKTPIRGYGLSSAAPSDYLAAGMTLASGPLFLHGSRVGLSLSSGLRHPMGWAGTGAFELEGRSVEFGWGQAVPVGERLALHLASRLAHVHPGHSPLLTFKPVTLMASDLSAEIQVTGQTKATFTLGREQPISSATASLRTAHAVTSDGRILSAHRRFSTKELVTFDKLSFRARYVTRKATAFGFGITGLRDGFGQIETFTGVKFDVLF